MAQNDPDVSNAVLYGMQVKSDEKLDKLVSDVAVILRDLDHGQRHMARLDSDVELLKTAMPDKAKDRLAALEADRQHRRGGVSMLGVLGTAAGSNAAAVIITYLLTRH